MKYLQPHPKYYLNIDMTLFKHNETLKHAKLYPTLSKSDAGKYLNLIFTNNSVFFIRNNIHMNIKSAMRKL